VSSSPSEGAAAESRLRRLDGLHATRDWLEDWLGRAFALGKISGRRELVRTLRKEKKANDKQDKTS